MRHRKRISKKAKREALFKLQGGLCYYCNQPMDLTYEGNKPPPWFATLEHLDDRWSEERGKHSGEFRVVLACWKCNNNRNTQRQAEIPVEIRRATSLKEKRRKIV